MSLSNTKSFALPSALVANLSLVEAVDGPFCYRAACVSGCRECMAEVENDDFERIIRTTERVGAACDCGKRCSGETFVFCDVAYCSLECVAIAIGEDADLVSTDDVIAQVVAALEAYWAALASERETARKSSASITVRPEVA